MLNNLFKLELPFISKNSQNSKSDSYEGIAYFIFQKTDDIKTNNKLIYNTVQFSRITRGAENYSDDYFSPHYLTAKPKLKKFRLSCFDKSDWSYSKKGINRDKNRTSFIGSLTKLNDLIIEQKATLKDMDAFISGSNSSGGLQKPNADPIRLNIKIPSISKKINNWMIFSALSNLSKKQTNYVNYFSLEDIKNIVTMKFDDFLKLKDIKIVPYGLSGFEIDYVNFKEAFISQNTEQVFKKDYKEAFKKANLYVMSADSLQQMKRNINITDSITELIIQNTDRNLVKNKMRQAWGVAIRLKMEESKHSKDFVKGLPRYQRAHIIEQKTVLNRAFEIKQKEPIKKMLKLLLSDENYVLLPNDIHDYWDNNYIDISSDGTIKNINLSDSEFKTLLNGNENITKIFDNVLTIQRQNLLKIRKSI